MKKNVMIIAGARPNFMKIAPVMRALKEEKDFFNTYLVHTGQHYDIQMSDVFFKELHIPKPNISLGIGSASHTQQTAKIMLAFEKILEKKKPDILIVVGDVNSTMACSLVAAKMGVKIAHVEAGLRSKDRTMPEEINRIVTDGLSDYLFVSEQSGMDNLLSEGVDKKKMFYVGNVMIDTLISNLPRIQKSSILEDLGLAKKEPYAVLTLHRPSNVDSDKALSEIYAILKEVSQKTRIIYPIHPRTKKMLQKHKFSDRFERMQNLTMIGPLGYINFMKLVQNANFVLTDSGGIQEETTVLKVPCLTMRENTERPATIDVGTNVLVGRNKAKIVRKVNEIIKNKAEKSKIPKYWDGKAAQRIVKVLKAK